MDLPHLNRPPRDPPPRPPPRPPPPRPPLAEHIKGESNEMKRRRNLAACISSTKCCQLQAVRALRFCILYESQIPVWKTEQQQGRKSTNYCSNNMARYDCKILLLLQTNNLKPNQMYCP